MKNYLFVLVFLFHSSCKSQNNDSMNAKTEYLSFPNYNFNRILDENKFVKRGILTDNNLYIEIYFNDDGLIVLETPNESYFSNYKQFYKNKILKIVGLRFNINSSNSFHKGIWYEFDENGKLTKETDYDKPYKFTFEDILKFCKKENIKVDKGPILQSTGYHTSISRNLDNGHPIWKIEHLRKYDLIEIITLDGITGKILEIETFDYINN